jgi:hypothetical protein
MSPHLNPAAVVRSAADIRICAQDVKVAVQKADWGALQLWEAARTAGTMLVEAKRKAGHGNWTRTLELSGADERRVQELMRVGEHYDEITMADGFSPEMSVREGLANWSKSAQSGAFESGQSNASNDSANSSVDGSGRPTPNTAAPTPFASGSRAATPPRLDVPAPAIGDSWEPPGDETPLPQRTPMPAFDPEGEAIPEKAKPAFDNLPLIEAWCKRAEEMAAELVELHRKPGGRCISVLSAQDDLKGIRDHVWKHRPTHVCPLCRGAKSQCALCEGEGWVTEQDYKAV